MITIYYVVIYVLNFVKNEKKLRVDEMEGKKKFGVGKRRNERKEKW